MEILPARGREMCPIVWKMNSRIDVPRVGTITDSDIQSRVRQEYVAGLF